MTEVTKVTELTIFRILPYNIGLNEKVTERDKTNKKVTKYMRSVLLSFLSRFVTIFENRKFDDKIIL